MYQFDTYRWQLVKCAVTSVQLTALNSQFSDAPPLRFMSLQLLSKLKLQGTFLQLQVATSKMCSYKCPTYSFKVTVLWYTFTVYELAITQPIKITSPKYIRFTVTGGTRLQFRNVSKFVSSLLNLSPLAPALPLPPSYIAVRMRTYDERERERRGERNEESMLETNKPNKKRQLQSSVVHIVLL